MWPTVTDFFKSLPERSLLVESSSRRFSGGDMKKSPAFCDIVILIMWCDVLWLKVTDRLASLPSYCFWLMVNWKQFPESDVKRPVTFCDVIWIVFLWFYLEVLFCVLFIFDLVMFHFLFLFCCLNYVMRCFCDFS